MQIRIAPSLGELEGHPNDIWGTSEYQGASLEPAVFFGLYGFKDFIALWSHKGPKFILWAGSDIRHFTNGYWLDAVGEIRLDPHALGSWIDQFCYSYVENEVEKEALEKVGIYSTLTVVPSFLGKPEDFPVSFKAAVGDVGMNVGNTNVRLYTSVSGNDFELYGWDKIPSLARQNRDVEFHLYGNTVEPPFQLAYRTNIILHGRVPKEQMNEEIKGMTGALRLTEFDGFSEILAKSVLMGQWPVSLIPYPHMLQPDEIKTLKCKLEPNLEGRDYYLARLNKYPWNTK